jgi:hypothetical protein
MIVRLELRILGVLKVLGHHLLSEH